MGRRFFRRYRSHRHLQASADNFSNVTHRHSFFGHGVIPRAFFQILQGQPVETSRIEDMHCRPAVASVANVSGYTLLAGQFNGIRDESLLYGVVNLRKAHYPYAEALCREGIRRQLRGHARNRVCAIRSILLCRRAARRTIRYPGSGGNKQGPVGACQCGAQNLYGAPVHLANFLELRKVMDKGRVDHAVRHSSTRAEAFVVIQIAAMHLGACGRK